MAKRKWNELSARSRRLIIGLGVFEGVLKVAALIDLARRPSAEVRGSKLRWALAVAFINSVGAAPIAYFAYGRQKRLPPPQRLSTGDHPETYADRFESDPDWSSERL